jgi:hypothetical protein
MLHAAHRQHAALRRYKLSIAKAVALAVAQNFELSDCKQQMRVWLNAAGYCFWAPVAMATVGHHWLQQRNATYCTDPYAQAKRRQPINKQTNAGNQSTQRNAGNLF